MGQIKVGIVGMGQRACYHGGYLFADSREEARVVAICDTVPTRLQHAKKVYEAEFGYEIKAYDDYNRMYDEAELDGVYIAGPNYLHRDMTVDAFARDLHVLCEKPMEVSLSKCDEMIEASEKSGKILALFMQMHYRKRYHKVREIIEAGVIGKPAMLWCTEYRPPFREMKNWVWEMAKSGGAIVEKNCHHYDILNLWIQSEPTTVYATGNIMKHDVIYGRRSEIVDNAWVVSDYECGARVMLGVCFLAQEHHYREFGVIGTEGKIFFSGRDREIIHLELNNGEKRDYTIDINLRGGVYKDFLDCIRTGREPLVTGEQGKKSLIVPLAAETSIKERRIVHVNEILDA